MRAREDGRFGASARLAAAAALAFACAGFALLPPGAAAAEQSEAEKCTAETFVYDLLGLGISSTLVPASGAEVTQHSPVTFSGESPTSESEGKQSEFPLAFEIGTSIETNSEGQEVVAHPYLDSGAGTKSAGSSSSSFRYSFTSAKAAASVRTIYWQASFTASLPHCNGGKGETRTFNTSQLAKPHMLRVVAPGEQPAPVPQCPSCTSFSPPSATGLKVGITAARLVHIGHPAVAYLVDCTGPCTGKTSFKAWQLRGRHRAVRAKALDFGPRAVSIGASAGGNERFTAHFRGRALKTLRKMLRGGHEVKLVVSANVKDAKGNPVQTQRVILLKG
jgi:hypothetical protein